MAVPEIELKSRNYEFVVNTENHDIKLVTAEELFRVAEPKLSTAEAKNTLKYLINCITDIPSFLPKDSVAKKIYSFGITSEKKEEEFFDDLDLYLHDEMVIKKAKKSEKDMQVVATLQLYIPQVKMLIAENKPKQEEIKTTNFNNLQAELINSSGDDNMINDIAGKDAHHKSHDKKVSKLKDKSEPSEYTDKYATITQAPDISDKDVYKWTQSLYQKANQAKGKLNSGEYNAFKNYCKTFSEIAALLHDTDPMYQHTSIIDIKNSDAKKLLQSYGNKNNISRQNLEDAYNKAWENLSQKARDYCVYKIDTKGFTNDSKKKNGGALDTPSRRKFDLMDQIFNPQKRVRDNVINVML